MQPQILVPFDFGAASRNALAWAADLKRTVGGVPIHVIHVLNPAPLASEGTVLPALSEDEIDDLRTHLRKAVNDAAVPATADVVLAHDVAAAIVTEARRFGANLIVMGTHGKSGLRRIILGSVAEYVVRHASCPVVTIRGAPAEESPARAA